MSQFLLEKAYENSVGDTQAWIASASATDWETKCHE